MKKLYIIISLFVLGISANLLIAQTYSNLHAWYFGQAFEAHTDGYVDALTMYTNAPDPNEVIVWFYGPFDNLAATQGVVSGTTSSDLDGASNLIKKLTFGSSSISYSTDVGQFDNQTFGYTYNQANANTKVVVSANFDEMVLESDKFYLLFFKVSNSTYTGNDYRATRVVSDPGLRVVLPTWGEFQASRQELALEYDKLVDRGERGGNKITICHYPPGNPTNVQTLEINENAWPAHQAHGDVAGECPAHYAHEGLTDLNDGFYLSNASSGQSSVGLNLDLTIDIAYTNKWRGNNGNKKFSDASNWSRKKVPGSKTTVVIEQGYDVPVIEDSVTVDILVVDDGATLSTTDNATIIVTDYLLNTGEIDGTVTLSGDYEQISAEGTISTVELNNDSGAILTGETVIQEELILTEGELDTGGNELILAADEESTAIITEANGSINGVITIQQYVPQGGYAHHYLASPLTGVPFSQLEDDFGLGLGNSFPHIYSYDEPSLSWVSPSSAQDTMSVAKGYTCYFVGEKVIDLTGQANSGSTPVALTAEGTAIEACTGWNFIGNPYPSPIDWDSVAIPAGMLPSVYVWDHIPEIWGRYTTYVDGISTNGGSNIIPMMQAFFVKAESNTTLTFENNCRITDPSISGNFYKTGGSDLKPLIRLVLSKGTYSTETVLRAKDGSTVGFDDTMDAILKESGSETGFEFSTVSEEGDNLVINTLPELVLGDEVGLYTFTGTAEEYVISLSQFEDIDSFDKVILYDSKTGVYQDLRVDNYVFTGDPDYGKDRFKMYLGEVATSVGDFGLSVQTCFAYAESGNVSVRFVNDLVTARQVNVYNSLGQLIDNGVIQQGDREITLGSKGVLSGGVLIIDVEGEAPTRVIMQ